MAAQQAPKRSEWTVRLLASAAILALVWSWGGRQQQRLQFDQAVAAVAAGQDASAAVWEHCRRAIDALHEAAQRGGAVGENAQSALDAITSEASK